VISRKIQANVVAQCDGRIATPVLRTIPIAPVRGLLLPSRASENRGCAMAFCSQCGQEIGNASFCPKCGASQGTTAPAATAAAASATAGLDENVAGLLCYILGWITGLIFLLIDKRPFVKFHAAQSIAMSIGVTVLYIVLGIFLGLLHFMHFGLLAFLLYPLLGLALFAFWIFVMYKAYQHEKFKLPIIGDLVEGMVK